MGLFEDKGLPLYNSIINEIIKDYFPDELTGKTKTFKNSIDCLDLALYIISPNKITVVISFYGDFLQHCFSELEDGTLDKRLLEKHIKDYIGDRIMYFISEFEIQEMWNYSFINENYLANPRIIKIWHYNLDLFTALAQKLHYSGFLDDYPSKDNSKFLRVLDTADVSVINQIYDLLKYRESFSSVELSYIGCSTRNRPLFGRFVFYIYDRVNNPDEIEINVDIYPIDKKMEFSRNDLGRLYYQQMLSNLKLSINYYQNRMSKKYKGNTVMLERLRKSVVAYNAWSQELNSLSNHIVFK